MPRPKFIFDYSKMLLANGNEPSKASINIYKTELNRLAAAGYTTKESLMAEPQKVIDHIKDTLDTKQKRRIALSAVFRVLQDIDNNNTTKRLYYTFFRESIESY